MSKLLWRKPILSVGTWPRHNGPPLMVSYAQYGQLMESFGRQVCAPVPFFIGEDHTFDPGSFRGEVTGLAIEEPELVAVIGTSVPYEQLKELEAAPQIILDYQDTHGRRHPAVLRHVLGTLGETVIPGLGGWRRDPGER